MSVLYLAPVSFPRRLSGSEGPLEGPGTSDYPLLKLPQASPSDPFLSYPSSPPTVVLKGTGPVQNNTCFSFSEDSLFILGLKCKPSNLCSLI